MTVLLGTLQLIPSPELSPISISRPEPKHAIRSTLTLRPHFLKIFLQQKYLNLFATPPVKYYNLQGDNDIHRNKTANKTFA